MTEDQIALAEANRIRLEAMRERYPGWEESLAETAAYLVSLGKTPQDYVRAWAAFRPSIEGLRHTHPRAGRDEGQSHGVGRLRPRTAATVFSDWRLAHAAYRLTG